MKYFSLIIPFLFLFVFIFASIKKVKIYNSFVEGVKSAFPLILSVFPYIATVMMLTEILRLSGLENVLIKFTSPVFEFFGIDGNLSKLVLIKPLSGSGSTAVLSETLATFGVDSYIGRCACVIYGSSETVFYIGAVYFSACKNKKITVALLIALINYFITVILGCLLCKFL